VAALARAAAPLLPTAYDAMLIVAALAWLAAFGGFVAQYGPMLLLRRAAG